MKFFEILAFQTKIFVLYFMLVLFFLQSIAEGNCDLVVFRRVLNQIWLSVKSRPNTYLLFPITTSGAQHSYLDTRYLSRFEFLAHIETKVQLWPLHWSKMDVNFLTTILYRGLRNDFFFLRSHTFFQFLFGLLFSFIILPFIPIPFLFGLLFLFPIWNFFWKFWKKG